MGEQRIFRALIWGPSGEYGESLEYNVGANCRQIELVEKSGMHSDIPYVQIFDHSDSLIAEFCQHSIVGVFYSD